MANRKFKIAKTATQALIILWEEGFLQTWKKTGTMETHLSKRGNNFSALKRAKHLTRRGKQGGYEYIQKYPFDAENLASAAKKLKGNNNEN
jgi:hypothetical protein